MGRQKDSGFAKLLQTVGKLYTFKIPPERGQTYICGLFGHILADEGLRSVGKLYSYKCLIILDWACFMSPGVSKNFTHLKMGRESKGAKKGG